MATAASHLRCSSLRISRRVSRQKRVRESVATGRVQGWRTRGLGEVGRALAVASIVLQCRGGFEGGEMTV